MHAILVYLYIYSANAACTVPTQLRRQKQQVGVRADRKSKQNGGQSASAPANIYRRRALKLVASISACGSQCQISFAHKHKHNGVPPHFWLSEFRALVLPWAPSRHLGFARQPRGDELLYPLTAAAAVSASQLRIPSAGNSSNHQNMDRSKASVGLSILGSSSALKSTRASNCPVLGARKA